MNNLKFLWLAWLAGLFLVVVDRSNAQNPPLNSYQLEYWSCTPSSCSNNSSGPVSSGYFKTTIKGLCYNGIQPSAAAWAWASNCSPPVKLTSLGEPTPYGGLTINNIKYRLDGVEAFSAVYDESGNEISFSDAAMWCDAENHVEESTPAPLPCLVNISQCEPATPAPTCPVTAGCLRGTGCEVAEWNTSTCSWTCVVGASPVLIDVSGNGFHLTSAAGGVSYDISGSGAPVQMAWTAPGAQDAFLCLPDASGNCNSGKQLFGDFTLQPPSSTPNGFAALAVYDSPTKGGNGDGVIDANDAIFSSLRLWIDANHDGISQPNELFTLPQLGITSISLNYKWDQRKDQYGNVFRYRAAVGSTSGAGRTAYDVFFVTLQPASAAATRKQVCPPRPVLMPEKTLR